MNNFSPGVEPISDLEFTKRLGDLQEEVCTFFRMQYRGMKISGADDALALLLEEGRVGDMALVKTFPVGTVLEMVFWV